MGTIANWPGIGDDAGRLPGRLNELGYLALHFEDGTFYRVAEAVSGSISVDVRAPSVTRWIRRPDNLVMRAAVFWHF